MTEVRQGREGSRWFNVRPTAEEFGEWFKTVPIHEGLDHEDFIGGITLIQSKEKVNEVVGFDQNQMPQIREVQHLVYVPYARVDTRVAYFWKLMSLHDDWLGVIEPHVGPGQMPPGAMPPGFFAFASTHPQRGEAKYVGSSMRVRILERESVVYREITETGPDGKPWRRRIIEGKPVFDAPPGSKIVPVLGKYDPDHHCVMKAETGAVGRALGMAGMLIIPGSGVATADDMQEIQAPAAPAAPEGASLPANVPVGEPGPLDLAALRARATALLDQLRDEYPESLTKFQEWARGRGLTSLDDLSETQTKGVVKKLEKTFDDAVRGAQEPPNEPANVAAQGAESTPPK